MLRRHATAAAFQRRPPLGVRTLGMSAGDGVEERGREPDSQQRLAVAEWDLAAGWLILVRSSA
jgi:hypothetical protein